MPGRHGETCVSGGIDWFRWHHGTVTDQKFPLIAKRAGASVAEVIAVWACLLESASMNEDERGILRGEPDFEAMDCALGVPDGRSAAIFQAMCDRDLIDHELRVTAWPRRQPKREREGDHSTERVKAFREKQRQETPGNASNDQGTPSAAEQRRETPRGEERREEQDKQPTVAPALPAEDRPQLTLVDAKAKEPPSCPHLEVLALWAEVLPAMPQHLASQWKGARADHLRARWRETAVDERWADQAQGLAYLRRLFAYVGKSPFLTGRVKPRDSNKPPFVIELEWLVLPSNWAKVIEGKYHQESA